MEGLYDKEITCPVCEEKYKTKKVKSAAVKVDKKDSDFCMHFKGENPLYYSAYVCPHCGYSSTEKNFEKITNAQKSLVKDNISSRWNGKDYGGERSFEQIIEVHKLIMLNYKIMRYPDSEMAKLCLKFAWFYRYRNDGKTEVSYLENSLMYFEKAYYSERLDENPENELNIIYLMGDINKRLGKYSKAINWFQMALKHGYLSTSKTMDKTIRESWLEAKDLSSKEKINTI